MPCVSRSRARITPRVAPEDCDANVPLVCATADGFRLGSQGLQAGSRLADGKPSNPNASRLDRHQRPLLQRLGQVREIAQQDLRLHERPVIRAVTKHDDGRAKITALGQQGPKVGVGRDEDPIFFTGQAEQDLVFRCLQATISRVHGIVTRLTQLEAQGRREGVVDQEPHCARRNGSSRSRTAEAAYCSACWMSSTTRSGMASRIS